MQDIVINVDEHNNKIVGLVENGKLVEKYDELYEQRRLEGNIYIGKVQNVLLGMQAAFVDIGEGKNAFIHIRDIIPKVSNETGNKHEELSKHDIKNYIKSGMPILVQVKRDSTNKKGARISTHISVSGRFAVIMPKTEFITISHKIEDEEEKQRLKDIVKNILPKGYGAIIRTSAYKKDENIIKNDINKTVKILSDIQTNFNSINIEEFEPSLLYKNDGVVSKILTDLIDQDIKRIFVNDKKQYDKILDIVKDTNNEDKIEINYKQEDLLQMYQLEKQLEEAKNRKVWLKCGGFITIDKTEALTAIDVNSGKYIGNKNLEQTVFTVNKEASIEIAKQIRLRDIGGIIIIDYIDMEQKESKEKIKEILEENLKKDRSKTQVVGFTSLDLLEMTRKHMCSND